MLQALVRRRWCVPFLLGAVLATGHVKAENRRPLELSAAASLTDVLQQIASDYTKVTGVTVRPSFAASSALARQIENGANVDLFVSADQEWMDYLAKHNLIQPGSRHNLLGNRLVLVAPAESKLQLKIAPGFPLKAALKDQRLAIADPDSVPAGRYAKVALMNLGVWGDVGDDIVGAENVRAALAFVARGEVPLGIVYETDALVDKRVRIIDVFPENSHPPITYPIALTRTASADAANFLAYLRSGSARKVFERYGFTVTPTDGR